MLTFCHYQIITQSINNGSHQTTLLTFLIVVHSAMNENLCFIRDVIFLVEIQILLYLEVNLVITQISANPYLI